MSDPLAGLRTLPALDPGRRLFAQAVAARPAPRPWRTVAWLLLAFLTLHTLLEAPAQLLHLTALNEATAELALRWLEPLGVAVVRDGALLMHTQGFVTEVHQHCTALIPAALLALAIGLQPGASPRAKLAGLGVTLPLIALANQLRLVAVVWVGVRAPPHFEWLHGVFAPAALVAVGVVLWTLWTRWALRVAGERG